MQLMRCILLPCPHTTLAYAWQPPTPKSSRCRFAIGVLTFDSLTLSGWFNSLADLFSLSLLACCFREIGPWGQHGATPSAAAESGAKGGGSQAQTTGVWVHRPHHHPL